MSVAVSHNDQVDVSEDSLLGGRVIIRQPIQGYRIAIDPILLAASIPALPGETVLDVGAGVGAAALCLASRVTDCKVIGLEVQRSAVRLAAENVTLNNMRERVEIHYGDLLTPPPRLAAGTFAHVMTNPPYLEASRVQKSAIEGKAISNVEHHVTLEQWAKFCLLMVRPKGTITFIHRADRLDALLAYFHGKLGDIVIFPLWPGEGRPAKRVLIRGRKSSQGSLTLAPGLVLHHGEGKYSLQAEDILRNGAGLYF
ncbi:MAG TPA: methyltransferase [Candidatus Nitrosotenuis sp.]|jgi:tRNA1(Val) A37 N6-methylase TrmN6|nr:methyltransferase [Candidatus Nitrosotenuis sp.]